MTIKIVFFNIPHLSVGRGGEVWESQVIEYLNSSSEFKAKLITTDCCYLHEMTPKFEYRVIHFKKYFGLNLFNYNDIKKDLEEADIVYYFNSFIGSQLPIIKHVNNINRLIFGYHAKNDWNLIQRIYYSLLKYKIRNIGYHHVLTKYQYEILTKKRFKNVFIVPNFVDVSEFKPKEKDMNLIIAPGAVSKEKGIETLIKIAKIKKDIVIYITGNKPLAKLLPNNIKYLGKLNREEYRDLLSKSVICLLPTYGETFSITLLECLASGNIVLARDLPVLREISGGIESVYFAHNNHEFIIKLEYILKKLNRIEELDKLSKISIERAKMFDTNVILEKFKNKLLDIINQSNNL
ncbi:glycosyl transferase group 1 [Sulfolobus islandicus M.14.25]|uniref:Glycosyl transferase group 1 n=1 Tax=Saccharolobus islandicus (strain M.14.25 / Kamchatka \|nr:glycosyltransferase [Sulfolobus islandicus]ACP37767.1 glycosyl transferase group 1 [Sulfolobus islandicus M.14.25]